MVAALPQEARAAGRWPPAATRPDVVRRPAAAAARALPAGRDRARLLRRRRQHPHQPGPARAAARLRHPRRRPRRRRCGRWASTAPPALVYLDKGLGAAILRAGVRLWDRANPSPAAAIKLTRHNLSLPDRAAARDRPPGRPPDRLDRRAGRRAARDAGAAVGRGRRRCGAPGRARSPPTSTPSPRRAGRRCPRWPTWSTAPPRRLPASARRPAPVRAGSGCMFNVALCRSWFGAGPWDDAGRAWAHRHPPERGRRRRRRASPGSASPPSTTSSRSAPAGPCGPSGGRRWLALARPAPGRTRPLGRAGAAGRRPSLLTSSYLRRRDASRILALLAARGRDRPAPTPTRTAARLQALGGRPGRRQPSARRPDSNRRPER